MLLELAHGRRAWDAGEPGIEAPEDRGVPPENLTDRVRVENEARHSGVDRAQPSPRLTQQGIELVPPLLAAVIGLRGKPPQPSQERKVFALDASPPCRTRRWSIGHRLPRW